MALTMMGIFRSRLAYVWSLMPKTGGISTLSPMLGISFMRVSQLKFDRRVHFSSYIALAVEFEDESLAHSTELMETT